MSNPSDRPWTEEEKYFLLTEILKKAGIPSNYLVRMINENRIQPNWDHIPLPPGRTMNSCRLAFDSMQSQYHTYPPAIPAVPVPAMPRPEVARASAPPIDPNLRKRPLYDKPRAIQPRPPPSVASYSSESGTSAQLSPRLEGPGPPGEPPRKRGRPSKLETERRKAAAEARGETYPPPRRSNSGRLKPPPSSPGVPLYTNPISQPLGPNPGVPYDSSIRPIAPAPAPTSGLPGPEERRDVPTRTMGPMRELPRPQEMGHPLPSPHALQLGPPDPIPRFNSNPGERDYAIPDRFSPDSGRRDSVTSRGDPPKGQGVPYDGRASTTPGEN
ncbi:hypothetical protein N7520_005173 [Penicillium odoratum]|uniref:uncharacterized protein n=1 Tax=Penicillium odoratum TaxID=1167516 RepID=UPI00254751C9|nr:uncharacterized protein N7520_005173 [Penicillium odoratum]KAJ5765614.1 hypothetical protein N7520_005173 [Penicillium odoratum]